MPLLTNSALAVELPHDYVAWALTTLFLRASGHFNTNLACRTGVLVRRLLSRIGKAEPLLNLLAKLVICSSTECGAERNHQWEIDYGRCEQSACGFPRSLDHEFQTKVQES